MNIKIENTKNSIAETQSFVRHSKVIRRLLQSIACFAGLQETAIPIMVGTEMAAQLKTGQVFHEMPDEKDFKKVAEFLGDVEVNEGDLEEAYIATPVIGKQRYQVMVTLLAAFSLQLTKLANQIDLEQKYVIELENNYIEDNLIYMM